MFWLIWRGHGLFSFLFFFDELRFPKFGPHLFPLDFGAASSPSHDVKCSAVQICWFHPFRSWKHTTGTEYLISGAASIWEGLVSCLLAYFIISTMGNNEICHYFTLWGLRWGTTGLKGNINRIIGLINHLLFTATASPFICFYQNMRTQRLGSFVNYVPHKASVKLSKHWWIHRYNDYSGGWQNCWLAGNESAWLLHLPAHLGDVAQNKGPSWGSTTVTLSI